MPAGCSSDAAHHSRPRPSPTGVPRGNQRGRKQLGQPEVLAAAAGEFGGSHNIVEKASVPRARIDAVINAQPTGVRRQRATTNDTRPTSSLYVTSDAGITAHLIHAQRPVLDRLAAITGTIYESHQAVDQSDESATARVSSLTNQGCCSPGSAP